MRKIALRGSARAIGAHVCGLRGIFSDALVVRKNDSNLFAAVRGSKVCDAEKETAFRYS